MYKLRKHFPALPSDGCHLFVICKDLSVIKITPKSYIGVMDNHGTLGRLYSRFHPD